MTWLTKELAEKILAITIDALIDVYEAITETPSGARAQRPAVVSDPSATQPTPPQPAETAETAEEEAKPPAPKPTLPEIQEALRSIARTGGTDWIREELFPGLGITTITELPDNKLPLAWELITTKQQETTE